jgi:hypothetical protein
MASEIDRKEVAMSDNFYNIYYDGPISPICKINDNLGLWTGKKYEPYRVEYIEPIMRSLPYTIDIVAMLAVGGVTAIPAYTATLALVIPALQMNLNELFHARWEPLDDVEGALYQLSGMARNAMRGGQSRTSLLTKLQDPWLASTTFWILGATAAKDAYIQTVNPNPIPAYIARFAFWGYRYMLEPLPTTPPNITYLPAQGR